MAKIIKLIEHKEKKEQFITLPVKDLVDVKQNLQELNQMIERYLKQTESQ